MNQSIVFTADVIKQINNLPIQEREPVMRALVERHILGKENNDETMTPMQSLIFFMLSNTISRASACYARQCGA